MVELAFKTIWHLLVVPFQNLNTVWPILPVYTSVVLGEIYGKGGFASAVGNGFVLLWAGLNWVRHLWGHSNFSFAAVSWVVAIVAAALGVTLIVLGIRRKAKRTCEVLGHTRFSCYFIVMLYPLQAGLVRWDWFTVVTILAFAIPAWCLIYLMGRAFTPLVK